MVVFLLQIVPFLLVVTLVFWPCALILKKAGYSRWLTFLFFVPVLNFAAIWWFALAKWPNIKNDAEIFS
jgi:hypothetical protein